MFFDTHCSSRCFGLVVGVALLLVVGLAACDKQPAGKDVSDQTQQPVAEDAVTPGDAAARADTVRKAERLLDHTAWAQWYRARTLIQPYLADPEQHDVMVWSVAGRIAVLQKNNLLDADNLAVFAAEAIGRLRPDYAKDEELAALMVELHARPIAAKLKLIPEVRKVVAELSSGGRIDDAVGADVKSLVGIAYANGLGISQDYGEALKWLRKAAVEGDADAMFSIGLMYRHGEGVKQNSDKAMKWLKKAAVEGVAKAMFSIGVMYATDEGVEPDVGEAVKWYRKAAAAGDAAAMTNLGLMYETGRGVVHDDGEAMKWYRKAGEGGDTEAMFNLAKMYANGQGVEQDYEEAVKWWRKAAEGGNAEAMSNLGVAYGLGEGVERDNVEKMKWYLKAAEGGSAMAMFNLGATYFNGNGVGKDDGEAVKWFQKAARKGLKRAQAALRELGESW
jgi:uncharacterized protein